MNLQPVPEKYLLRRKKEIVQSLRSLAKAKSLITGRFDTGKYSFLTVVIDVVPENHTVILDYGSNEAINSRLLCAAPVVFMTRYKGIKVRFSSDRVEKTVYQNRAVFKISIPESLFWQERRESYRVRVPLMNAAVCRIPIAREHSDEAPWTLNLRVVNIGPSGVALALPAEQTVPGEIGTRLCNCTLVLPKHSEEVDLEIRHRTRVEADEDEGESWIGCTIVKPSEILQSRIMQYMQSVERQQKEFER
ncbi:MAG: flagellar brake protein [Methylococcaceae bacterium]|nr:flagellar brake protein [Methylococcaceae bacterium]MCI0733002.1 flagellar brake protein [Methylococcaceae bacterium]